MLVAITYSKIKNENPFKEFFIVPVNGNKRGKKETKTDEKNSKILLMN